MDSSKRPAVVTFVGWAYVLVSLLMLLSGLMGIVAVILVEAAGREGLPKALEGAPAMFYVTLVFVRHFGALAFLQVVVASLVLFCAAKFMRLRAWARSALELFTWLSLLGLLSSGFLVVRAWLKMTSEMPPAMTAPLSSGSFTLLGAALWGAFMLLLAACAGLLLWALRSRTVREAVS